MSNDELLTVQQAADVLQVSHWTVRRWLKSGRLMGHRLHGVWRVPRRALDGLLARTQNIEGAGYRPPMETKSQGDQADAE